MLYAKGHNFSDSYKPPVDPEIPDVDVNDDKCNGRIERIRFHTGKTQGRHTFHITVIKLNSFTNEHYTEETLLRGALFKAYKAQSIVRIDSQTCTQSEIKFKGFSIITKGTKPQRFGKYESAVPQMPGNLQLSTILNDEIIIIAK